MKQKFSLEWKASKQPRKQRKYRANAPLHIKHKLLGAHLSKELRKKYQKRKAVLRKDDTVRVMRGVFKKRQGKILSVNTKKGTVYIEGLQKTRKDGTKVNVPFHASNLLIITLVTEDKKRTAALERKAKSKVKSEAKSGAKSETKPAIAASAKPESKKSKIKSIEEVKK